MIRNYFERIVKRKSHYRAVFNPGQSTDVVLADLKRFCKGMGTPLMISSGNVADPFATAVAIGRQEVWLRIISHLNIDDSHLLNLKEEAQDE